MVVLSDPPAFRKKGTIEIEDLVIPRDLHFYQGDTMLMVSYLNHGVVCWDLATGDTLWQIEPRHDHSGHSAFSPSGKWIAVFNLSSGIDIYSVQDQRRIKTLPINLDQNNNVPMQIAFVKGGKEILSGAHYGALRIWDVESGNPVQRLGHKGRFRSDSAPYEG
ncbi:YVTN repeat-like/Quino protein amine dehydrogenase [Coprinopsis marcescibilis]|uniref:YVTN repeat-like/Quino protein amine dehydrogenase n=1 Tax=Coprinopsis marcescibilis TaxID=230819 RepID=A0A5C3KEN5_COPMA|nr:YVTN repeat-like/Quino protein amine dehydrogenase [Coprinopsis marcescibilis]